jgi:hypothetical protein
MTIRSWNTTRKLLDMMEHIDGKVRDGQGP